MHFASILALSVPAVTAITTVAQCPSKVAFFDVSNATCSSVTCTTAPLGTRAIDCTSAVGNTPSGLVVVDGSGATYSGGRCFVLAYNTGTSTGCLVEYNGLKYLAQQAKDACPTTAGYSSGTCIVHGLSNDTDSRATERLKEQQQRDRNATSTSEFHREELGYSYSLTSHQGPSE
ncbi:hypothetical protein EXIGLDRAFT_752072 [Exidia glandulosa HHB12029]|uniref:Uncharacterized protein n=1 Tax=Exidia glandulosa HHB12029 TaxID=1314781 RepID=A0A166A1Y5_EXIGL|nr:hypothetical protein EXIGLDRAFT_752072 [Exidia glandulosa HHB12029]